MKEDGGLGRQEFRYTYTRCNMLREAGRERRREADRQGSKKGIGEGAHRDDSRALRRLEPWYPRPLSSYLQLQGVGGEKRSADGVRMQSAS